jgi:hypothetical protein
MAKKRGGGARTGLADAIRAAIGVFGHEPGKETTEQIRQWVTQNYPGLDVNGASFGTALSVWRKRSKEAGGVDNLRDQRGRTKRQPEPAAAAAGGSERGNGVRPAPAATGASDPALAGASALLELQRLAGQVGAATVKRLAELL